MSYMESMRRVLLQGFDPPLGSYAAGLRDGWREERERIIALLEDENCPILISCTDQVVALIKGENE